MRFGIGVNGQNLSNIFFQFLKKLCCSFRYTVAIKCHELGFFVVAGCFNGESDGAKKLIEFCGSTRMVVTEVDIRNNSSIEAAQNTVNELVVRNGLSMFSLKNYLTVRGATLKLFFSLPAFSALVNNAGIMAFGEFEWQTIDMIESQIQVNLLGTMKLTKVFLPMCRQFNARVIIVTSHCAMQGLPSIAPYAASKGGLKIFLDALRVEMRKYHVDVVNFIPGSFIMQSNIFARQQEYALEMEKQLTEDQLQFYDDYFHEYNNYLRQLDQYRKPGLIDDVALTKLFERALLEVNPHSVYIRQNWR